MDKVPEQKQLLFSIRGLKKNFPQTPENHAAWQGKTAADRSAMPCGFEALAGIDLDIYERETTLIAGPNGSGKTLLMRILTGLMEPSGGEIFFKGKALDECGKILRRSVGLVFQNADSQILGETVEEDVRFGPENLKLPKEEIESRVEETLASLGLAHKRDFPARRLSGGETRRLAVAGILAMGCETVIMDEPFANLDWPGVVQVLRIISGLKQSGKTVIILTHELEKVLALADRLVILAEGQIKDQGECEAVLDRLDPAWGVRDPRKTYRNAGDCTWLE